ncbi:MAG: tetratricopeptide repeat protein [Acidobacteria bacterium]|nr:tetratricopeptide repeat protein [Acidobacteriota bacterium]
MRMATGAAWLLSALMVVALGGCRRDPSPPADARGNRSGDAVASTDVAYVGRQQCGRCHEAEVRRWEGSHHDLAMQEATPTTVLGDFRNTSFTYGGVTTRFTTRDSRFIVSTDGPDGAMTEYEVAYVFGVYPLQQYLIAFPGGRYQALSVVWDARAKADGGQRWYHLYPNDNVSHGDVLHWTGFAQNWNAQCAACHSTNLRKGYDADADTYKTTWSEMDVSCEACHGPASAHVAWADARRAGAPAPATPAGMELTASMRDRRHVTWAMDMKTGIARRSPAADTRRHEVEICAPCHARRSERVDGHVPGQPWLDAYAPAFLSEGLYRADGQMQDEVYNYGSFLQSRMYAAGVTCSDCHDPHSLKPKAGGNALCAQCHLPSTFDVRAHHGHAPGSTGASCVACHMPTETYMGVDTRHDHGFRVPRPDLTERLGVKDTCTSCHAGKTPAWAAAALDRWRTPRWRARPQVADAVAAARHGRADAGPGLAAIARDAAQPAIVRGTAIESLSRVAPTGLDTTLDALAADADPLVRLAVAQGVSTLDPAARARVAGRLLDDPLRAIRLEAASALAGEPAAWLTSAQQAALAKGLDEVQASARFNADRPESHVNIALLDEKAGRVDAAMARYETAIRRTPWFIPAYVNLAELQRHAGREAQAEQTLRRGLTAIPENGALLYALGLSVYRQQRGAEAVDLMARAARAEPDEPRYAFAYALALDAQSRFVDAFGVIDAALARHPDDRDLLDAGLGVAQKTRDIERARRYVGRLRVLAPDDSGLQQLARQLGLP